MPRLSRASDPKRIAYFIGRFWDAVTLIEDRAEAISFLKDLLTPTEVRMLAKRLQIAYMLAQGYKYEDIRNYTHVTSQTISAVSNKLSYGDDGFWKILEKLEKIEQNKQNKLEGKRDLLAQPSGLGRAVANITSGKVSKLIRSHKKKQSILTSHE